MDWFRRNWPDLLIGIALVAVIAGIIATLITGGSFFPVGQTTRTTTPPAQNGTTTPGVAMPGLNSTPGSSAATSPTTPSTPGAETPGAGTPGASGPDASTPGASGAGQTATSPDTPAGGAGSSGISVLPPAEGGPSSAAGSNPPSDAATTPPSSGDAAAAATTTSTPSTAAGSSSGSTPSTAADGPGDAAPFRISVGAFSQMANARAQVATFQSAGYPVFLAEQGDLNLVLVGPYTSESEADAAADRIRGGGFNVDPVIYRFSGDADSAPAATSTTTTSSTAASTASPSTASPSSTSPSSTSPSSTSTTGTFIQVGAYGSAASAQPQNDRISSMGFRVTERTESDLIKLLIGPFDGARLAEVQAQLDAAGIESFARR